MTRRKPATTRGRRTRVALLIETSNAYARELLHGIQSYARENRHWALHLTEQGRGETPPAWLRSWRGDGMIARVETKSVAEAVRQAAVPVVNVSAAELAPEFPTVISDSAAIARLAAEHLLERGFRHFGYCGDARFAWSARHGENFVRHLADAGFECAVFDSQPADAEDWEREQRKLARWLRSLPKPAGVMACYDIRGQQVLDVCRAVGVAVPDEVAVIGQHNDELLCDLCDPPLSSVIPNARRAGYEAAALLDRMMRGERSLPKWYDRAGGRRHSSKHGCPFRERSPDLRGGALHPGACLRTHWGRGRPQGGGAVAHALRTAVPETAGVCAL